MYIEDSPLTPGTWLFRHIFGDGKAWLVTFTGRQARLDDPAAKPNELARTAQRSWWYPGETEAADEYLRRESARGRDAYFCVHLFEKPGNRLRANACATMSCLWLDEDDGRFPDDGPEPTAIIHSSSGRRHLYWRLGGHPAERGWVVDMNRRIASWANGDAGKAGPSSVLRAPGTMNYKRHPVLDPVRLEITGTPSWAPEVMEQAIPLLPEPEQTKPRRSGPYAGPQLDLADYLETFDAEVLGSVPDGGGSKFAVLCPWVDEHTGGDRSGTFVGQYENGALWFWCWHAHCVHRGWAEFRRRVDPRVPAKLKVCRARRVWGAA